MHQLVVAALQECRVNRHDRLGAFAGHASRERDRMLFSDGHVEITQREALAELDQVRAFFHRRGNPHQALVRSGHVAQPVAKDRGVFWPAGHFGRCNRCVQRFELGDGVVANRVCFRRGEAFAFFSDNVQELRAFEVTHVAKRGDQRRQIMAVNRADVVPAELFEQRTGHQHAFGIFLGTARDFPRARQARQHFLAAFAHAGVRPAGQDFGQVVGQPPDIARDRHVVVVEDHQHVGVDLGRMVQGFKRHASGQGAITDHGNCLAITVLQAGGYGHA